MIGQGVSLWARGAAAGVTALGLTLVLTPIVRAFAVRGGWIAKPAEDRWGRRVIARFGGIAMFGAFLISALLWVPMERAVVAILVGVALVFALGVLDDLHRMPPYTKLVFQLLIGCVLVILGVRIELHHWAWLSIPLSVLWLVLVMNAFNLLDNMDGLAAGVGAIAAAFCAFHGMLAQQWSLMSLSVILCGACVGFLRFNFPPAKIYMGDSGSHVLGLALAALVPLSSWHQSRHLLSVLAVPVFVLAVPIFDTCFVTIQRLANRKHPFVGGTDHVSHRLAVLGLSTRQTVAALYAASVGLGLLSVWSAAIKPLTAITILVAVVTGLVVVGRYLANVNVYRVPAPAAGCPGGPGPSASGPDSAGPVTFIDTMLLHKRRLVEVLVDFSVVCSAYLSAYLLRFDGVLSPHLQRLIMESLPMILVVKVGSFIGCGLYRRVWRNPDLSDILTVFKAVTIGSVLSAVALLYVWRFEGYSRAVIIIDWMLSFLAVGGSRVAERVLDEWIGAAASDRGTPVLILGAGNTGERVLRYLKHEETDVRRVVAFLDDDARKHGSQVHGVRVIGARSRLDEVLAEHDIREVLVAINDPPGELLQYVQRCCEPRGVAWKVVTAGVSKAL